MVSSTSNFDFLEDFLTEKRVRFRGVEKSDYTVRFDVLIPFRLLVT